MLKCKMLKNILLRDEMLMSRLGIALGSLFWSIQLLFTCPIFVTRTEAMAGAGKETYRLMTLMAPEWAWGAAFGVHAAFAFYTLFSGNRSKMLLAGDGVLGMLLWTASTLACYFSHWNFGVPFIVALQEYRPPAAMSGSVVIALYAWWHMIRSWAEEDNHKLPSSAKTEVNNGCDSSGCSSTGCFSRPDPCGPRLGGGHYDHHRSPVGTPP